LIPFIQQVECALLGAPKAAKPAKNGNDKHCPESGSRVLREDGETPRYLLFQGLTLIAQDSGGFPDTESSEPL
jgi:hypothetical protein